MAVRVSTLAAMLVMGALTGCQPKTADAPEASTPQSTASDNVLILPQQLDMVTLPRQRTIRVYLPPGYEQSDARYPVLYMHDAQNLFDDRTSYSGEWGVDETLNRLSAEKGLDLIVVGIDNGGEKRLSELSPWDNPKYAEGEGEQYTDFIVDVLKPQIDSQFRTLTDAEHTGVMGSSLGGLLSHYAVFAHPDVFSKAGILSPSYWYADEVYEFTAQQQIPASHRLYLIVGGEEGQDMVSGLEKMQAQILRDAPQQQLNSLVEPTGKHNEASWRNQFADAVSWLFLPPEQ